MRVFLREDNVARLIADEVFVIGRNQQESTLFEASRATIVRQIEFSSFVFHLMDVVAQKCNAHAAITFIQSRPPNEIIECSRLTTLEVFTGKTHQRFFSLHQGR